MRGGCGMCLSGGARTRRTRSCRKGGKKACGCGKFPTFLKGGSALIGQPWTSTTSGNANYYSNNGLDKDPQYIQIQERDNNTVPPHTAFSSLKGGRRRKYKIRGGGFIPQDIVNLGRNVTYGAGSAYNALMGYPKPVNPAPYMDQMTRRN